MKAGANFTVSLLPFVTSVTSVYESRSTLDSAFSHLSDVSTVMKAGAH